MKKLKRVIREFLWNVLYPVSLLFWRKRNVSAPRRVLLMNATHLGDIVISTGILPVLHSAFPGVEVGYAAGSWAEPALKDHPLIAYTHWVDPPSRNRAQDGFWARWKKFRRQRAIALKQIRELHYDWAIALNSWKPDFLDLAWRTRIPVRAAYKRHLTALLATHLADSPEGRYLVPEGACQTELLRVLGIKESDIRLRQMTLAPDSAAAIEEVTSLVPCTPSGFPEYFIIHMGAGNRTREMPPSFWREVAASLAKSNVVIFTGQGARESENARVAIENLQGCINSVDRLSWKGLVALVRHAKSVFSIDTSICHVAAAAGTPLIAVYTGITGVGRWRPEGEAVTIWTNHVPCSPCGRQNGCKDMTCLKGIRPVNLLGNVQERAVPTVRPGMFLTSLTLSPKCAETAQREGETEKITP